MKLKILSLVFLFLFFKTFSQRSKFQFLGEQNIPETISFKLINNLIIVPIKVNGKELSFILDTGVNQTILFSLNKSDSLQLNNVKQISLQGLGSGKPIDAYLSKSNTFEIGNISSSHENIYIILKDAFNLSAKVGETIHGIIGYNLLKDLIVKVNYFSKKITFYNPDSYQYRNCKRCEVFPLEFYRNKPYINAKMQIDTVNNTKTDVKLLVDSGGSEAIWLFEKSKENIVTPKKYFKDILGVGLSGNIYGNKSKIPEVSIGSFTIKKPTVSFLDSLSSFNARKFKERNGSIGGGILKHFNLWIDYPNSRLTLKKKKSLRKRFYYNMSGINITYNGQELIEEEDKIIESTFGYNNTNKRSFSIVTSYSYKFKPSYKVESVLEGSPAGIAGILEGDIIKSINNRPAYSYKLNDIVNLFQSRPDRKIKIEVERFGFPFKYEFILKKRI